MHKKRHPSLSVRRELAANARISGRGPLVLFGLDTSGYFKVTVPEGGRFTIGPGGAGLGPFALRIYRDKTNASMILFNPGIQWIRENSIDMTRPIEDPGKVVELLMEIAGVELTPDPSEETRIGCGIAKAITQASPFYSALKKRI